MSNSNRPQARRGPSGAWSRFNKPVNIDPLDIYGLPSKGEKQLLDHKNQEVYYTKIVERYMNFCASSGGSDELEKAFAALALSHISPDQSTVKTPSSLPDSKRNDMPMILLAMRKLREGIVASNRYDSFAQRAYRFIIHVSLLTRNWESYSLALWYLLHTIHLHTPLSPPDLNEFAGYYVLDLACRQQELTKAYSERKKYALRDRKVNAVLSALVHDDWVRFWRIRRAVDGYQRAVMEFAIERMRVHALKCLGRSYMHADRSYIERSTDTAWDDLVKSGVGWELTDSGNVIIRRPKAK